MPDLIQSLQGKDLSYLRMIAELWGIPLKAPDARTGLQRLSAALKDTSLMPAVVQLLPLEAREALNDLIRNEGRLPWAVFTRRYGLVREMGPAKRDREKPHQNPDSVAEMLWYRALVARAFFDAPSGAQEYAYIPEDMLALMDAPQGKARGVLGRPASPKERANPGPVDDRILDHACTLLAALRLNLSEAEIQAQAVGWGSPSPYPLKPLVLQTLLSAAGLLGEDGLPQLEPVREFLEAPRGEALATLARAWLQSATFNELLQLPGLVAEGDWRNDPVQARQSVLDFILTLPQGKWWSLGAFVNAVRHAHADFQRPAGDYDSWFLRDAGTGDFLRGFEHWDEVDGALVRYLLTGPMFWLGIVELASAEQNQDISAFRISSWGRRLLEGLAPEGMDEDTGTITLRSDGKLNVPRLAPRAVRYQLARFSHWEGEKDGSYRYRLTPSSLDRARQQGLRLSHLMALLRRHAESVPPNLATALDRWESQGTPARIERATILRLSNPELLQALRGSRAARFLGDPLGPAVVIVKPGAWQKVIEVLAEMGYLGEGLGDSEEGEAGVKQSPE